MKRKPKPTTSDYIRGAQILLDGAAVSEITGTRLLLLALATLLAEAAYDQTQEEVINGTR